MFCAQCGKGLLPEDRFCGGCGTAPQQQQQMPNSFNQSVAGPMGQTNQQFDPFGQPTHPPQQRMSRAMSTAITGLILGAIGIFFFFFEFAGLITSIAALVMALKEKNKGAIVVALIGIVVGLVGIYTLVLEFN